MPSKNPSRRLCDILENVAAIEKFKVVDDALVWHTVQHDLVPLREAVEAELAQCKGSAVPGYYA